MKKARLTPDHPLIVNTNNNNNAIIQQQILQQQKAHQQSMIARSLMLQNRMLSIC